MAAVIPVQRLPRNEGSPTTTSVGSQSSPTSVPAKKLSNWLPLLVGLVVLVEIAFLGRLDMAEKANLVNSWADSFYQFTTSSWSTPKVGNDEAGLIVLSGEVDQDLVPESCEEWLQREDSLEYSRDFDKDPIFVHGGEKDWKSCAVGCKFGVDSDRKPDAAFGTSQQTGTAGVLRSMESAQYYPENDVIMARRRGYDIIMTTSLSSDVPVGYFSWAEYDIMAPVQPKTENALAAAFISNCGARNFRLQALEVLEREKIKIDSFGSCHHNRDGNGKEETLELLMQIDSCRQARKMESENIIKRPWYKGVQELKRLASFDVKFKDEKKRDKGEGDKWLQ